MKNLLFISIHGFHTLRFIKPVIWRETKKTVSMLKENKIFDKIKYIELGYKNILYSHDLGNKPNKFGFDKTFNRILNLIDDDTIIVIAGHSLGGFASNILTSKLIDKGYKIFILTQIDALPIYLEGPVYNGDWFEFDKIENQTIIDKYPSIKNKLPSLLTSQVLPKYKYFKELMFKEFDRLSDDSMTFAKNLLDSIKPEFLKLEFIKSKSQYPHLHQLTFDPKNLKHHYYYFCDIDSWDISNHLVHFATNEETGPIEESSPNLINYAIHSDHVLIPAKKEIYKNILDTIINEFK